MTRSRLLAVALAFAAPAMPIAAQTLASIPLPPAVTFPEGVAYDPASNTLFAGSSVDGTLVRIDAATGTARTLTPAGRIVPAGSKWPAMLGMKVDGAGHLWIAGGWAGLLTEVDEKTGRVLRQSKASTAPKTLLNDLVIVGGHAYVTDTFVPILWRAAVTGADAGKLEPWIDLTKTPIAFADGPNLNGIAATADGRSLIVVQMNKGKLFRVDVATRKVTAIDTGASDLVGTDGLLLQGHRLYAVGQWKGAVVTLDLSDDLARATEVSRYADPAFVYPATIAKVGQDLVAANTQFNRHDDKAAVPPFALLRVPLARLGR